MAVFQCSRSSYVFFKTRIVKLATDVAHLIEINLNCVEFMHKLEKELNIISF